MSVPAEFGIVRIVPAGDSALLVEFPQRIDPQINAAAIVIAERLRERCGAAIRDAVIGYATLTVYFDPLIVDAVWLESEIRECGANTDDRRSRHGPAIDVPVCYGGEFGPDLSEVSEFARCSEDEVVTRHTGATYRVYLVGFVPGFAYMAPVDPTIAAPRRSTPRPAVPPGSVGIAGPQTGIYPSPTPGGWNIIGRTPLRPYDIARPDPFLFHAGDTVRFRSIAPDDFNRML